MEEGIKDFNANNKQIDFAKEVLWNWLQSAIPPIRLILKKAVVGILLSPFCNVCLSYFKKNSRLQTLMVEIRWHRWETRRQMEKTNINLQCLAKPGYSTQTTPCNVFSSRARCATALFNIYDNL